MKVNMTPNPLDVVTIHASQGDTEARQWEFELHNNGELIDTSEITEQLFFKAYKGGTEQILPENGSVPVTAPFNGDIKYPQGLLTDQEFTYRESPTEEDGNAKITDIKGNTLVWNQLVQNGNFADTSNWRTEYSATISASNNVLSLTPTAQNGRVSQDFTYKANHKLLIMADVKLSSTSGQFDYVTLSAYAIDNRAQVSTQRPIASTNWQKLYVFCYSTSSNANNRFMFTDGRASDWGTTQIRNFIAFDLTLMFGETKADELFASEQSQVGKGFSEFTSLFPLSYYSYNQGSLLSFNGNGIKTVGKNLLPKVSQQTTISGITYIPQDDGTVIANGTATGWASYNWLNNFYLPKGTYTLSGSPNVAGSFITIQSGSSSLSFNNQGGTPITFELENDAYVQVRLSARQGTVLNNAIFKPMLELGSSATEYKPYTSSTLSLPISTYFPTGMKSAGSVYDELTPRKAITKIGAVDLGSLDYFYTQSTNSMSVCIDSLKKTASNSVPANILTTIGKTIPADDRSTATGERIYAFVGDNVVYFRDIGYTDPTTFKNAMNGVMLYYELATPTKTSFTTASLVTENAEIPLSNDDGVLIGKCTEELSAEPGFHDAKIKLSDSDGECYSNKLQLHVERSPQ